MEMKELAELKARFYDLPDELRLNLLSKYSKQRISPDLPLIDQGRLFIRLVFGPHGNEIMARLRPFHLME